MVDYTEWTEAVHTAYQDLGGTYDDQSVVQRLTELAAQFWNENKQELLELAFDAAVKLAKRVLDV